MVIRSTLAAVLAVATAATALAQDERLSGQDVRDFMLGKRMSGVLVETNETWFECVASTGETVYSLEGQVSTGFVEVEPSGRTCFTYPRGDYTTQACFHVEESGGKTVFVEVQSGMQFRVDTVDTEFDQYPTSAPVS